MGYTGMCGIKAYGFSTVLVITRVSILADFGHFGHGFCILALIFLKEKVIPKSVYFLSSPIKSLS